jgi:signal transduction histidine kinase
MRKTTNYWMRLAIACLCAVSWNFARGTAVEQDGSQPLSRVAQLCELAGTGRRTNVKVSFDGLVCWADSQAHFFLFEDDSGTVAVSSEFAPAGLQAGLRARIEGKCTFQRCGLGFILSQALVVDNDGLHDHREKNGLVSLEAGLNPIRLTWFNSRGAGVLNLSYQGPGVPRQKIPDNVLYRAGGGTNSADVVPGVDYRCWLGEWGFVPYFNQYPLATSGVVSNFDISVRPREESVGMEFSALLKLSQEGLYTFYLESDDGSFLSVGPPSLRVTVTGKGSVREAPELLPGDDLAAADEFRRRVVEGEVAFVEERDESLRLEIRAGENRMLVDIADGRGAPSKLLLGSRVRVTGICYGTPAIDGRKTAGYLWVPSWREANVIGISDRLWQLAPLVAISNVVGTKMLSSLPRQVRIAGQVQRSETGRGLKIVDSSGALELQCAQAPPAAESWVEALGAPGKEGDRWRLRDAFTREQEEENGANAGKLPLLTSIAQVSKLTSKQAGQAYPVKVQGVVTAKFENGMNFVIQNAGLGIYVNMVPGNTRGPLEIGDLCEVVGITREATWAPSIAAQQVKALGIGRMPEPLRPSRDQILNGILDSQYVEIQGIVTDVYPDGVKLLTRIGRIEIDLGGKSVEDWRKFQDALIRVRGCALAIYDRDTRLATSGKIRFIHPAISVDEFPPAELFTTPAKSVAALRAFDSQASPFQRIKVSGQVVHAGDGFYCLMQGTNGLRFAPRYPVSLQAGDLVDVVGILDLSGPSPNLNEALIQKGGAGPLPEPAPLMETNLLSGPRDATLVRLQAVLVGVAREGSNQVLELRAGGNSFGARLSGHADAVRSLRPGSKLQLTGAYQGKGGDWASGQPISSFDLALNAPDDIRVLTQPSWWTPRRLLFLVVSLVTVLLLAAGWIHVLHRQVEERTRQLAQQIQARQAVEQQRAVEQERTRLARDLHDDLGGGLTEISMLGFLANDAGVPQTRKSGYLQQMTEKARDLVTALDEIVWAVNPRYDSLASLAAYCSLYAQRFLGLASIKCHLDISTGMPDQPLESNLRHSLFLAFKEALSNVVRHAEASEVHLRIQVEGSELLISIADNGRGLPGDSACAGMDGLANMKERLAAVGGQFEIQTGRAKGTTVIFRVSLNSQNHDQSRHS